MKLEGIEGEWELVSGSQPVIDYKGWSLEFNGKFPGEENIRVYQRVFKRPLPQLQVGDALHLEGGTYLTVVDKSFFHGGFITRVASRTGSVSILSQSMYLSITEVLRESNVIYSREEE